MLTRIRNANSIGSEKVVIPYTNVNFAISKVLRDEGFISSFNKLPNIDFISIDLKFKKGLEQTPYISCLNRVSKPGLRVYVSSNNIPKIWGGIGIAVFILVLFYFFINNY